MTQSTLKKRRDTKTFTLCNTIPRTHHTTSRSYTTTTVLPKRSLLYLFPHRSRTTRQQPHLQFPHLIPKSMGCAPSRTSSTFYDEYFAPSQHPYHRQGSRRIANVDGYKPEFEYRDYRQLYEQNVATERYEDAYDQLTARSKLSRAHGLEAYYEDRGW